MVSSLSLCVCVCLCVCVEPERGERVRERERETRLKQNDTARERGVLDSVWKQTLLAVRLPAHERHNLNKLTSITPPSVNFLFFRNTFHRVGAAGVPISAGQLSL